MTKNTVIIYAVTIYQLITGLFIVLSPMPIFVARLGIFYKLFSNHYLGGYYIGGLLMILGGILAIHAIRIREKWNWVFFLPQYFFLLLSSGSILAYIIQQRYADGVIRPWQFILIDQLLALIITGFYTTSIFRFERRKK